jgi:hypothetical protein
LREGKLKRKESEDQQLSFFHQQVYDHKSSKTRGHIGVMFGVGGEQKVVITTE